MTFDLNNVSIQAVKIHAKSKKHTSQSKEMSSEPSFFSKSATFCDQLLLKKVMTKYLRQL